MPQPDSNFQTSIVIACEGPEEGVLRDSPAGVRRSRNGAKLDHVIADAKYWAEHFYSDKSQDTRFTLLQNPSRSEVVAAITESVGCLHHYKSASRWGGGQINLVYAGHGTKAGELVLSDACLSAEEIANVIAEHTWRAEQRSLRLSVVLDCCFSGKTLAELLLHPFHGVHFLLVDSFAAALHEEYAWQLDTLRHGAHIFMMRNRGNAHVDQKRLARAVEKGDDEFIWLALQALVPNPVTYLTEGVQHSIALINGHALEVKWCGTVETIRQPTMDQLLEAIENTRDYPGLDRLIVL